MLAIPCALYRLHGNGKITRTGIDFIGLVGEDSAGQIMGTRRSVSVKIVLERNVPGGLQMNNLTGLVHDMAGEARAKWVSGFMAAAFLLLLVPLNLDGQAVSRINGEVADQ